MTPQISASDAPLSVLQISAAHKISIDIGEDFDGLCIGKPVFEHRTGLLEDMVSKADMEFGDLANHKQASVDRVSVCFQSYRGGIVRNYTDAILFHAGTLIPLYVKKAEFDGVGNGPR